MSFDYFSRQTCDARARGNHSKIVVAQLSFFLIARTRPTREYVPQSSTAEAGGDRSRVSGSAATELDNIDADAPVSSKSPIEPNEFLSPIALYENHLILWET